MNILVTGASKGIGAELAKLASREHYVFAIARDDLKLQELKKHNPSIHVFVFDLEKGNFSQLAAEVKSKLGTIDIVINNAGMLLNKPFLEITERELQQVYNVNVFGVFKLTQNLLPLFSSSNSHIVNISSMGGFQGSAKFSGLSAYSSSKGALSILTECLAEELKENKIAVNCLCLGAVQTEMLSNAFPGYKAPVTPLKMAEYILNFALTGQHYFNGKILPVSLSTP
ncbi:MAG: SDR family oxidoreductase [Bacteroidetes bacterium]|nr:SDR family oxidoreductase [Bacteroidota bacterium]